MLFVRRLASLRVVPGEGHRNRLGAVPSSPSLTLSQQQLLLTNTSTCCLMARVTNPAAGAAASLHQRRAYGDRGDDDVAGEGDDDVVDAEIVDEQ